LINRSNHIVQVVKNVEIVKAIQIVIAQVASSQ
jgi:hypothetical protein